MTKAHWARFWPEVGAVFGRGSRLATVFLLSAGVAGPVLAQDTCVAETSTRWWLPSPAIILGVSFFYESRVPKKFPVGSSAARLIEWLDANDYGPARKSLLDTAFADEADEQQRMSLRIDRGQNINLRVLKKWAPIGTSYFSVAWNADDCGRITEIYADTELFQFDMP